MDIDFNPYSDVGHAHQTMPFLSPDAVVDQMPESERMELFAQEFSKLANLLKIPAAWVVFKEVEGGLQTIAGGHPAAVQLMCQLLNQGYQRESTSGSIRCVKCHKPIPPGKAGRACRECRNSTRLILP